MTDRARTPAQHYLAANPLQASYGGFYDVFLVKLKPPTRTTTYAYDGLLRLTGAAESPGTTYGYSYDAAGNRTGVWVNGTRTLTQTFNAANQVAGYTYDAAGNLTDDGTATYGYDALHRMTQRGTTVYTYTGDGTLAFDGTTRYTQDLAAPLSQILQTTQGSATTDYLYGMDRLAAVAGGTRTWYGADALGSVRQTLDNAGAVLGSVHYDPWGTVESGTVPMFGFTGELQDVGTGLVNLRARWYATAQGRFVSRDPFAGLMEQPQTLAPYPYAENDPVNRLDPSGKLAIFVAGFGSDKEDPNRRDPDTGVWAMAFAFKDKIKGSTIIASSSVTDSSTKFQIESELLRVVNSCSKEPIILVGHSLGARVIMEVADAFYNLLPGDPERSRIDLLVTLDIAVVSSNGSPGPLYGVKSPNVKRQLNITSDDRGKVFARLPIADLPVSVVERVDGAENLPIVGASHTSVDNQVLRNGKANDAWRYIESAIQDVMLSYP